MFDINSNSDIKSNFHPDYVQNWQNFMKEVYFKIHQKKETLQTYSKSSMTRKYSVDLLAKSFIEKIVGKKEGQRNLEVTGKTTFVK